MIKRDIETRRFHRIGVRALYSVPSSTPRTRPSKQLRLVAGALFAFSVGLSSTAMGEPDALERPVKSPDALVEARERPGLPQGDADGLRHEVAALGPGVTDMAVVAVRYDRPRPSGISGKGAVENELDALAQQIAALDQVVAKGLDPALAAPAYANLEGQRRALQLELIGVSPPVTVVGRSRPSSPNKQLVWVEPAPSDKLSSWPSSKGPQE